MAKQTVTTTSPAAHAPAPTIVKVRATRLGHYGNVRRRPGDVFSVPAHHVSTRWMEPVPANTPETATTAPEALRREHATILAQTTPPQSPIPGGDAPTGDQNPLDV
jgi:hypothetical protein